MTQVAWGFGFLPAVLVLPGTFLALRRPFRRADVLLAGTAITFTGITLFIGMWLPRYFLSLLVIFSALAALALERLGRLVPSGLARLALLVLAMVAIRGGYPYWRAHYQHFRAMLNDGRDAFLEARAPYFAVARWLNGNMRDGDKVAIGFNIQPFYYLERPYFHIHHMTQGGLVTAQSPEAVEAELRRVGATLLAFSPSDGTYSEKTAPKISAYRDRLWLAQRQLRRAGRLRFITSIEGVRILRLEGVGSEAGDQPQYSAGPRR